MISDRLLNAVLAQLSDDREDALATLPDVCRGGADAGFGGFTYYRDTCQFFDDNRAEIIACLKDEADQFGTTLMAHVKSFRCLADVDEDEIGRALYGACEDGDVTVPNGLAWWALESAADRHDAMCNR